MPDTTKNKNTKPFLIAGGALIAAIWIGVFAAFATIDMSLKTKALVLACGAGATELVLYAGAAWFGITFFKKMRSKMRLRRK